MTRPAISDIDVRRFLVRGEITIDTPLSRASIDDAAKVVDARLPFTDGLPHYRFGETCSFFDRPLVEAIEHPFFEAVAQRILDAPHVRLHQTAITIVYPQPRVPWTFEQHIDVRYRAAHWEQSPRHVICSFFLWLSDVKPRGAPMMCRPGSHRLLASDDNPAIPLVAGVAFDQLPALDYAEPVPVLARAGQVSVVTTGMVHGSSVNADDHARRALVMTYCARGVEIELPSEQERQRRSYLASMYALLSSSRRHLARP